MPPSQIRIQNRRSFLQSAGLTAGALATLRAAAWAQQNSPFHIGVISDEISPDLDHACSVISKDFGLSWVELRVANGKNVMQFADADIAEARKTLEKYNLKVTDIASPLYKVDWPGAPRSQYAEGPRDQHGADPNETFKGQQAVLEKAIHLARSFGTDKVRCFDFWRLDGIAQYRKDINDVLQKAAETAAQQNVMLVLENEFACNTATGRESGATLAGIPSRNLALNWDPGNAVMRGELDAFPGGWNSIPKDRIHHCHVKNAIKDPNNPDKIVWSPVDKGYIDWAAQFRALKAAGYREAVNLETHWRGGNGPEASTRVSWAGMKKELQASGTV